MANNQRSRSSRVGAFLAAASLPRTFQRSLLPRDTIDQGAVSGLVMAIVYAIGAVMQDGVDATASAVAKKRNPEAPDANQANYSFIFSNRFIKSHLSPICFPSTFIKLLGSYIKY